MVVLDRFIMSKGTTSNLNLHEPPVTHYNVVLQQTNLILQHNNNTTWMITVQAVESGNCVFLR